MSGNLAQIGPTLVWIGVIGLIVCGVTKLADWADSFRRRRRTARVIAKYERYGYGEEPFPGANPWD